MQRHPVEALLRPPVEWWSAFVAGLSAVVALVAPWALMMTPAVAWLAAAVLMSFALWRWMQGWRVLRYQRNLRRLPEYRLTARRIPLSRRKLFLGLGFPWTQKHTQRLRDTIRPEVQHYIEPGRLYRWARRRETAWEGLPVLRWVAALLGLRAWWNPSLRARPWGQAGAARGRTRRGAGVDGSRRAGRAYPGAGDHPCRQDAAGRDPDRPGHPPRRRGDRVRSQGRWRPAAAHVCRVQARRSRARVLHVPPRASGDLGALQRDRVVLAHHRGGHAHRQPAAGPGQLGRVQGVRLALHQHRRACSGRAGTAPGLPPDRPAHHPHRRAAHRLLQPLAAQGGAGRLATGDRRARGTDQRTQPPVLDEGASQAPGRPGAVHQGSGALRSGRRRAAQRVRVRQDLLRQDRREPPAAAREAHHRQDRRADRARLLRHRGHPPDLRLDAGDPPPVRGLRRPRCAFRHDGGHGRRQLDVRRPGLGGRAVVQVRHHRRPAVRTGRRR
jgi:hypothetical protein